MSVRFALVAMKSILAPQRRIDPNARRAHRAAWPCNCALRCSAALLALLLSLSLTAIVQAQSKQIELSVEQITHGTKHHFFGYIGQCQTIPWNASGRYILAMEISAIDRLPEPHEAATIMLIDTHDNHKMVPIETTHAWNPQQGTMFYWHPQAAENQFFFNDRDVATGEVYTVLYDVENRRRVREFRYRETPIGNAGVAPNGTAWLGLNYGRLARLRLVTGYPQAPDWSQEDPAPANDGIFIVNIATGQKQLLVSYRQLDRKLRELSPELSHTGLFINHTLWNRDCDRVYFFVRAGWSGNGGEKINQPCSINSDGSGLTLHPTHIGGHPEWAEGSLLIGRLDNKQVLYDVEQQQVVRQWGTPEIFPKPEGDVALSLNGRWFVNGHKQGDHNFYTVFRRSDGAFARSPGIFKGAYDGDIRIDPAPRWNRTNDSILIPGIANNGTRQLFVIRVNVSPPKPD